YAVGSDGSPYSGNISAFRLSRFLNLGQEFLRYVDIHTQEQRSMCFSLCIQLKRYRSPAAKAFMKHKVQSAYIGQLISLHLSFTNMLHIFLCFFLSKNIF